MCTRNTVVDRVIPPQRCPHPNLLDVCLYYLTLKKSLCRCDQIKELEMDRLACIIQVAQCNWRVLKRVREGDGKMKAGSRRMWFRFKNAILLALKMGKEVISQCMQSASRSKNGKETDFPLEPPEGMHPYWQLDFGLIKPILNFWLLK